MSTAYATTTELENRYASTAAVAQVTDTEASGTPDTTVLQESLDYAAAEIDAYLATRYKVPFVVTDDTQVDALVRNICLDLAQWHLASVRVGYIPDAFAEIRTRAIDLLEKIRDGKAHLPTATVLNSTTTISPAAESGVGSSDDDSPRLFTREHQEQL